MDKGDFEPRIRSAKERLCTLEEQAQEQPDREVREHDVRLGGGG